jgi:hypothetical protein
MNQWIISYENDKTLNEILKIGTIEYEPIQNVNFIVMNSYLSRETILNINGVLECKEPYIGTVYC